MEIKSLMIKLMDFSWKENKQKRNKIEYLKWQQKQIAIITSKKNQII